ncbi:hypothetical protein [Kutzneria sp. NPDC051319]|uniref:hypothetical protein n=1 Tax=Kutzneria sp. NPDC051319 TaxID=3155047 RepID=UPI0034494199
MTVLSAATATPGVDLSGLLTFTLIVVTVGYLLLCMLLPVRQCRRCHGMGRIRSRFGGIRTCGRCRGQGLRIRTGRRVWNWLAREFDEARRGMRTDRTDAHAQRSRQSRKDIRDEH